MDMNRHRSAKFICRKRNTLYGTCIVTNLSIGVCVCVCMVCVYMRGERCSIACTHIYAHTGEFYKGFEPLIGAASIQYANDEDWLQRKKWLYPTLKGEDLKSYFPHFVKIAQVVYVE